MNLEHKDQSDSGESDLSDVEEEELNPVLGFGDVGYILVDVDYNKCCFIVGVKRFGSHCACRCFLKHQDLAIDLEVMKTSRLLGVEHEEESGSGTTRRTRQRRKFEKVALQSNGIQV